ncbi:hypothetical protein SLEP1_g37889 [Rubroshorea leprosula]|uniref:Uncharacterized protein n=1 Tax=Rubroshorea leprosula TaxID=152421 RepID=A0AAV5KWN8_9ROSI|nr:hypothetical protein SLEP1_g37889 [Rubroshorea leprosula]
MMKEVWLEMLLYAAFSSSNTSHVKQLGEGGEFLSLLWLLGGMMVAFKISENRDAFKGKEAIKDTFPPSYDPSASPRTPSVISLASEVSEEDLRRSLEEASSRLPSLTGKSAFIGRVNDVDSESKARL